MNQNSLFLNSLYGSKKGTRQTLTGMNRMVGADDFPIPGFRRCQFPIRTCFPVTNSKAQGQSISGLLGIDFTFPCSSHGQFYVASSRTNPRNIFACTGSSTKTNKNVVYPEVLTSEGKLSNDENVLRPHATKSQIALPKNPMGSQNILNLPTKTIQDAITVFEDDNGKIPDLISCGNVTLHSSSVKSVISHGTWVDNSAISAFFALITFTFDATFLTLLRRAKHQNAIKCASEFFRYQYNNSRLRQLIFSLRHFRNALILIFNGYHKGNRNQWGLAAFDKSCGIARVYDSLHDLYSFRVIL